MPRGGRRRVGPAPPPLWLRRPVSMDDFKRSFYRGLAALLPTLLTFAVLFWAYDFVDRHIGQRISHGLILLLARTGPPTFVDEQDALKWGTPIGEWLSDGQQVTEEYKIITHKALQSRTESVRARAERQRNSALWRLAFAKYKLHLIGFVIAIVLVYFMGFFLASFIGRTTLRMIEDLIRRVPLVRAIYPNIKQVTDFLLSDRPLEFSGVVAVEYPRKGIWSLGLLTGSPMKLIQERDRNRELVTVFIPSSPTPMTGYTITVAKDEVIVLDLSIDEALRFTISGGVIKPGIPAADKTTAKRLPERTSGP
jgi:uncharacterized membrane protein